MNELDLTPDHQHALRRHEALLEEIPRAEAEREHLVSHTLPLLNAMYLKSVGTARLELLSLQLEAFALKRKAEMIRSAINRDAPVMIEVVEALVEAEIKEQREKLLQEAKRVHEATIFIKSQPLSDEDAAELKAIYHRLARLLHPDLHPDISDAKRELWLQVSAAYQQGDLDRMRVLAIIVEDGSAPPNMPAGSLLSELQSRNRWLESVLERSLTAIRQIKDSFPYNCADKLEDPEWISEQLTMINTVVEGVRAEMEFYTKSIEMMLKGGEA